MSDVQIDVAATRRWLAELPEYALKVDGHLAARERWPIDAPEALRLVRVLAERSCVACLCGRAYWAVAAETVEDLERILRRDELWEACKRFGGVPTKYVELLISVARSRGLDMEWIDVVKLFVFSGPPPDVPELPPDARLDVLRAEDAETVALNWTYLDKQNPQATIRHVAELIASVPSSCVRAEGGLASWALVQSYGAIGMLFTQPAHRRRKLARCVVADLTRRLLAAGSGALTERPYAYCVEGNQASMDLLASLGYREAGDVAWLAFRPPPPRPAPP